MKHILSIALKINLRDKRMGNSEGLEIHCPPLYVDRHPDSTLEYHQMDINSSSKKEMCQLVFSLILAIIFLVFSFTPALCQDRKEGKGFRLIYGGNLLGTIKPCG